MKKIDLVIPTYNRPELLKRILDYYQPYKNLFRIIVADSSRPENKAENRKIIKNLANMKIVHLDHFSSQLEQHHKFAEMTKFVKSKYCVFCADDDFIVPRGVLECVKFLDQNPDYVVAHGTYISFFLQKTPFGGKKFLWRYLYPHISIDDSTAAKRAASHLTNYTLSMWGVQRSEIVKLCQREAMKVKIATPLLPMLGELLPDTLTAVHGKIKRLKTFYSARQCFSQVLGFYPSLFDAKKMGIYDKEISKFKDSLIKNMHLKTIRERMKADKLLDQAIEEYQKDSYQQHIMGKVNKLLAKSPKFLSQSLSAILTAYLFSKPKNDWVGLVDKHDSKYYKDFEEIRQCVLNHPQ
jgi:glycosyltransferase domain-containing protein